jgi:hypothetical protein
MNSNQRPHTAKIYQFPLRNSRTAGRPNSRDNGAREAQPALLTMVESGGGWYHDAAIQAEPPRKS